MRDRATTLARIYRVRTLQLGLTRADEARALDQVASETALSQRIAQLAAAVSPAPASANGAFSLAAAAHYRERLHRSADSAAARVVTAEMQARTAAEATQAAHRDQSAVEKLIARANAADLVKETRLLEAAATRRRNRHDPC